MDSIQSYQCSGNLIIAFFCFQSILIPRVRGGADAAGAVPAGRADGPRHPAARAAGVCASARRGTTTLYFFFYRL